MTQEMEKIAYSALFEVHGNKKKYLYLSRQ